jgi:hypothetical protein
MSNQAGLGIGDKVHNQEINEYPADLQDEYLRLSEWVRQTYRQYGAGVRIQIVDPQSLVGLWKHLRYGIRRYPTFIVDGRRKYTGWEAAAPALDEVERLLVAEEGHR